MRLHINRYPINYANSSNAANCVRGTPFRRCGNSRTTCASLQTPLREPIRTCKREGGSRATAGEGRALRNRRQPRTPASAPQFYISTSRKYCSRYAVEATRKKNSQTLFEKLQQRFESDSPFPIMTMLSISKHRADGPMVRNATAHERPAVDHNEEQQFHRQRHDWRREHHHAKGYEMNMLIP